MKLNEPNRIDTEKQQYTEKSDAMLNNDRFVTYDRST